MPIINYVYDYHLFVSEGGRIWQECSQFYEMCMLMFAHLVCRVAPVPQQAKIRLKGSWKADPETKSSPQISRLSLRESGA